MGAMIDRVASSASATRSEIDEDAPGDLVPPRVPQQARSREKHERLLEAARSVFNACGYEGATIDAIAERAGVSVGVLYRYFRSKRQIFLTLVVGQMEQIEQHLLGPSIVGDEPLSPGVLEASLRHFLRQAREDAGMRRARQELLLRDEEYAAYDTRRLASLRRTLAAALERRKQRGELRADTDCSGTAFAVLALFPRLPDLLLAMPEERWDAPLAATARLLYHALIPDPPPQAAARTTSGR